MTNSSLTLDPTVVSNMRLYASVFFGAAVLHTFAAKSLTHFANKFPPGSISENLFHFLGEVEVVFGLWAAVFIGTWSMQYGTTSAALYLEGVNFTEAAFVFVIMCIAASRPVLCSVEKFLDALARMLPLKKRPALYLVSLIVGPLLGSLITEPAAMTVTALMLRSYFFTSESSVKFRYATLGLLFVNVSIGGTLTHFAAPPVLMVAAPWNWDTAFMAATFGWRAALAIVVGTVATTLVFRREMLSKSVVIDYDSDERKKTPFWVIAVHLGFLVLTIVNAHHMSFFIPLFLLFLGWCSVAKEYQDDIRIRESLLVGLFLGGLVTLGKLQDWWLQPLLTNLSEIPLFWGALSLTAVTDNAALTYLGTLVPGLSDGAKYALVAGAVAGGGLTVIANAPNPAGYGLLRDRFGEDGISPIGLFLGALPFTILAAIAFLF